jgi:hypothetical protein
MIYEVVKYEQAQAVQLMFSQEHGGRDIDTDDWEISDSGLYTSGAAPCIVMAGHNPESGRGLLGHFPSVADHRKAAGSEHTHAEKFESAVEDLIRLGEPRTTEIWLGGGAPFMFEGLDTVTPDREQARRVAADHLSKMDLTGDLLNIRWSDMGHSIDVELDCQAGILLVHDYLVDRWTPQEMRRALEDLQED